MIVKVRNTFSTINTPIMLEVANEITAASGTKYLDLINDVDIDIVALDKNVKILNHTTFTTQKIGSYALQVFVNDVMVKLFNIYTYENLAIINSRNIYTIFNQELPRIYNSNNPYNEADNYAISRMFAEYYAFMYEAYSNSFMSLGINGEYNRNLEELYFSSQGVISSAVNPAQIINLLIQISAQTGTTFSDIAIFISKLVYAITGTVAPVRVYQNAANELCHIELYYNPRLWRLGVDGFTELGRTTILGSPSNQSLVSYLVLVMVNRLMPVNVKWVIDNRSLEIFNTAFNVAEVLPNYYMDTNQVYDAYAAVNNNNIFNTKGYMLNV